MTIVQLYVVWLFVMMFSISGCGTGDATQAFITVISEQDGISTETMLYDADAIHDIAWSADSQQIALATSSGLWLYQVDTASISQVLTAPKLLNVHRVAFSHEGQYIVANSIETILEPDCHAPECRHRGWLYVWDSVTGNLLGQWEHGYYYSGLVTPHVTHDGKLLLAVPIRETDKFRLYDVSLSDFTPNLLFEINTPVSPVRSITFSDDGQQLFVGGGRLPDSREAFNPPPSAYHSYVYDTQTGTLISELETRSVVYEGQFDNAGTILITSSNSGIQVWDVASVAVTRTIESRGHVDISRDSQTIAYVNCDDISRCRLIVDLPNDNQITHTIFYEYPNYLTVQGLTVRFNDDLTYVAVAFARELYLFEL